MSRQWPVGTVFKDVILKDKNAICPLCNSSMHVRTHREHKIYTLETPVRLICKLLHCSNEKCPNHNCLFSPTEEDKWTLPGWKIGWNVFTWMGFLRFKRHWSVPQIREVLNVGNQIVLSDDAIEDHLKKYRQMVAARQQDLVRLKSEYRDCKNVLLSIDGLQPEKGHETLYVVRELRKERVWFAEPLVSSSVKEIEGLIRKAQDWVKQLDLRVDGWVSDKQNAFVTTIAHIFSGIPHRYCKKHFMMAASKEMLEIDSHAKVQMRRKIRGLRAIEQKALEQIKHAEKGLNKVSDREYAVKAAQMIIDYCSVVRGILNENTSDALHPAGMEMVKALNEVQASIRRNLSFGKTGFAGRQLELLAGCIAKGVEI